MPSEMNVCYDLIIIDAKYVALAAWMGRTMEQKEMDANKRNEWMVGGRRRGSKGYF